MGDLLELSAARARRQARALGIAVDLHRLDEQIADIEERLSLAIVRSESCRPEWLPGLCATVAELWAEREELEGKRERALIACGGKR